jgi:glutaredoxin
MPQICPHCHHIRKVDEVAPDWQCPACERAYVKGGGGTFESMPGSARPVAVTPIRSGGGLGKWLLLLLVLGAALWFVRPAWLGTPAQPDTDRYGQPEVVLYATSWCGYCKAAREFFAANGIEYTELDVEKSSMAQEGHRRLGGGGVPLIVVGDTVIHGFNQPELRRALGPWLKDS